MKAALICDPTKEQMVFPEGIRKELRLRPGSQIVVVGKNDVAIRKAISPPAMEEVNAVTMNKPGMAG